jgi:hypothetical protein
MNTPREPNVRTRSAEALDQARGWARQHSAPNVHRPILTLYPKTLRHVEHPVSPAELTEKTGQSKLAT